MIKNLSLLKELFFWTRKSKNSYSDHKNKFKIETINCEEKHLEKTSEKQSAK